ncbi:hypothetical protein [Streptomyces pseudovenezuelae]|uniref:Roadblock/LAMTOR2 domain-containing protein n=1 Tax=Streptomyces pseudovenezuelae TaxID=67350 RepID=A0ABT6LXI7_9ACTN|nr:hypothetical protein [Streptomyces pseudovenezuelae]
MSDEVMCADQAERGLVCVVQAPAPHLAVELGNLLHRALVVGGAVLCLAAREPGQCLLIGVDKNTTVVFPAPLMSTIGELGSFLARETAAAGSATPPPASRLPSPAPRPARTPY